MHTIHAKPLDTTPCTLGESPLWHAERNSLFWVDIEEKTLFEYPISSGVVRTLRQPRRISRVVRSLAPQRLIAAMEGGICRIDLDTQQSTWLCDIEKDQPSHRCNDGNVDSHGRLWVGTMCMHLTSRAGNLYRIAETGSLQVMIAGVTIPNGLVWSEDQSIMYFIDTAESSVEAFRYDTNSGDINHWKTVIRVPPQMGSPDGMAIDTAGKLWIAHYGGFGVYRWDPDTGMPLLRVAVPTPQVTSCVFGGENMDTLFITSAAQHLDDKTIEQYPLSGATFYVQTGFKGHLAPICSLPTATT